MGVDLEDILTSVRVGGLHEREKHFIDPGTGRGIDQVSQIEAVAAEFLYRRPRPEDPRRDLRGEGSADAYDADACLADRSGHSSDGVIRKLGVAHGSTNNRNMMIPNAWG